MITRLVLIAFALVVTAMAKAQEKITPAAPGITYGKLFTAANAIPVQNLEASLKNKVYTGKVEGKVVEVCTKKGCFMKLEQADKQTVTVRFKDYAFFMPQNIVGKTVVVNGIAKQTTTSVDDLQHYAEDAGKSETEIAAIKSPITATEITASGVLVVK